MGSSKKALTTSPGWLTMYIISSKFFYHRRIWDSFEGLVDELMRGEPGGPSAVSLGLYKNQPAILASSWLDGSSYEELYIYPVEESKHPTYIDVRDWN